MNEVLKEAIADELNVDPSELTNDKLLEEIEDWDSVTALVLVVLLSDEAGVPITPAEMGCLRTYGDIETLVMEKKASNQ